MTDLEAFRDHAHRMATAIHQTDCPSQRPAPIGRWIGRVTVTITACTGCVPEADRRLWAALADEVDAYLAGDEGDDETLFDDMGDA